MEESLKAGHSLEFFIEGGRSRTGKAVLPKAGLLSIVVDTLMSGNLFFFNNDFKSALF